MRAAAEAIGFPVIVKPAREGTGMGVSSKSIVQTEAELREQLDYLRAHGCDEVQGFLFSRPVPAREISREK